MDSRKGRKIIFQHMKVVVLQMERVRIIKNVVKK